MMKVCVMFSTETYRSSTLPNWITVQSYTMFFQLSLSSMKSVMSLSDLNAYLKKKRKTKTIITKKSVTYQIMITLKSETLAT